MLSYLLDSQVWLAFGMLTALELVLGVDNIVFISILTEKLPADRRECARRAGLLLALFLRLALLLGLSWVVGLTVPLFSVAGSAVSGRMLILGSGGLFLMWKSAAEIRGLFASGDAHRGKIGAAPPGLASAIIQIMLIDLVFSLDSIVTAVGMVDQVFVMIAAVLASVLVMMAFAGRVGRFIAGHATVKMLALAFLLVVGGVLIAEGLGYGVPKGYVYSAAAFSLAVELANIRLRKRAGAMPAIADAAGATQHPCVSAGGG